MKGCPTLFLAGMTLAACGHGSADQAPAAAPVPHPRATTPVKHGPTPQEATKGMVEAVNLGTSSLPVAVKFELSQRPVVGHAIELGIAVLPQISAGPASVSVTGSDGLNVGGADVHVDLPSVDDSQVYRQTLTVTPTAEGMQTVTVNVMLHHDDANDTRSFAVPIIVDAP